jgi:hypothetical protein
MEKDNTTMFNSPSTCALQGANDIPEEDRLVLRMAIESVLAREKELSAKFEKFRASRAAQSRAVGDQNGQPAKPEQSSSMTPATPGHGHPEAESTQQADQ